MAENFAVGAADAESRVAAWLDGVKRGFGERFAASFIAIGVEDVRDLAMLKDAKLFEALAVEPRLGNSGEARIDADHKFHATLNQLLTHGFAHVWERREIGDFVTKSCSFHRP